MSRRLFLCLGVFAGVAGAGFLAVPVGGQGAAPGPEKRVAAAAKKYTPARTAGGQPDLQGVWANNMATPLERPDVLKGRALLTDEELARVKQRAAELFAGDGDASFGDSFYETVLSDTTRFTSRDRTTGDYNQFWVVEREIEKRTSLITDPPDGKLPALVPQATARRQAQAAARKRIAEGPEDRGLSERCISFGIPRLGAAYNSYLQIVQHRDYVAINTETIHDTRMIPLDGRPHLPPQVRLWHGDSRGHWEGDTLVVDTTNYSAKGAVMGATEKLHVVERFTRVDPKTINYEVTFEDPDTWTRPWTAMVTLRHSDAQIYEFACHEGNIGMEGILSGARAQEKAEAAAATK